MAPVSNRPSTLSLKGRALQLLAQREQSRAELRRKLLPYAALEDAVASAPAAVPDEPAFDDRPDGLDHPLDGGVPVRRRRPSPTVARRPTVRQAAASPGAAARVDALLDWLEAHGHLSEARFVESRVHSRAARYGTLRIRHELAQHRVDLPGDTARALQDSEPARAAAVWQRKFGAAPPDAAARARQMRFLAGRGFSADAIRRAVPAVERGAATVRRGDDLGDDDDSAGEAADG